MTAIAVSAFRSRIPAVLKKVLRGESIALTTRGRTIALLVPPSHVQRHAQKELKKLRPRCKVGDVVKPVEPSLWEALR